MNSLQHGFGGNGGKIRVETSSVDEDMVRVRISDNGVGMADEVRARVFDPFFTTKMGQGGTGLGMNIVHSIVTRILGGHVSVESAPGEGTLVSVDMRRNAP